MFTSYYKVAGHSFALHTKEDRTADMLPSFTPFVTDCPDDNRLLFSLTVNDDFYPTERGTTIGQFDCGGADFGVYRLPDGCYQFLISPPGGDYCGLLQTAPDFRTGTVALRGSDWARAFAVNNSLMLLYAFAAADKNTLLFHASVIGYQEQGYLFLGKSGTGKSTHSTLWLKHIPGSELMNDDNPVVVVTPEGAIVYGSPWSGKTPCYRNVSAPVGAFVRIRQEKQNTIERDNTLQAFASLLPSVSSMKWDDRVYDGICDTLSLLIEHVPSYTLGCLPDKEAAELCHDTVTEPNNKP